MDRTGPGMDRTRDGPDQGWTGTGMDQDRTRTGPGPDQDRTRTGPGPDQDRTRTGPGPDQDRTRTGPGPDQGRTGSSWFPGPGKDISERRDASKGDRRSRARKRGQRDTSPSSSSGSDYRRELRRDRHRRRHGRSRRRYRSVTPPQAATLATEQILRAIAVVKRATDAVVARVDSLERGVAVSAGASPLPSVAEQDISLGPAQDDFLSSEEEEGSREWRPRHGGGDTLRGDGRGLRGVDDCFAVCATGGWVDWLRALDGILRPNSQWWRILWYILESRSGSSERRTEPQVYSLCKQIKSIGAIIVELRVQLWTYMDRQTEIHYCGHSPARVRATPECGWDNDTTWQ